METFTWSPRIDADESVTYRTLAAQFGDGYKQEVADGINSIVATWTLVFVRKNPDADDICNFLDRHKGAKTFQWSPPWGSAIYWTCSGRKRANLGAGWFSISVTFSQSFRP